MQLPRIVIGILASLSLSFFVCFACFVVYLLCPSHASVHGQPPRELDAETGLLRHASLWMKPGHEFVVHKGREIERRPRLDRIVLDHVVRNDLMEGANV